MSLGGGQGWKKMLAAEQRVGLDQGMDVISLKPGKKI